MLSLRLNLHRAQHREALVISHLWRLCRTGGRAAPISPVPPVNGAGALSPARVPSCQPSPYRRLPYLRRRPGHRTGPADRRSRAPPRHRQSFAETLDPGLRRHTAVTFSGRRRPGFGNRPAARRTRCPAYRPSPGADRIDRQHLLHLRVRLEAAQRRAGCHWHRCGDHVVHRAVRGDGDPHEGAARCRVSAERAVEARGRAGLN